MSSITDFFMEYMTWFALAVFLLCVLALFLEWDGKKED